MQKKYMFLILLTHITSLHPEDEYIRRTSPGSELTTENYNQQAKITQELEERWGRNKKATSATTKHEPTFQDWLHESPDHVITPVYSNGTTTPFHEAVLTGNNDMGSLTIQAAQYHGIKPDQLLQPLKEQYESLSLTDEASAHQLANNVEAIGNKKLADKFNKHVAQTDILRAVNGVHRDTWNLDTTETDKPGMTEQDKNEAKKRFINKQRSKLPISKIERVVRRAIIHDVPLDTLLEPFQTQPLGKVPERMDPEMMKRLQKIHRQAVQRMVITEVYHQMQSGFESAQVVRDTSQQTHDKRGKIKLKTTK